MSNKFVRHSHKFWYEQGISFLSLVLPTSHYISESYTDDGVQYTGSALVLPSESVRSLELVVNELRKNGQRVGLQGHSFGTNLIRSLLENNDTDVDFAIYMSPADSAGLQQLYTERSHSFDDQLTRRVGTSRTEIAWDIFGIASNDMNYAIPIDRALAPRLFGSLEFNAWTGVEAWDPAVPSLVIVGAADPVSQACGFADKVRDLSKRVDLASRLTFTDLDTRSHTFEGASKDLFEAITNWGHVRHHEES